MANEGKKFEAMFHKSICCLEGASMRIEDGGKVAKNRQWGDFLAWDYAGNSYLFECKSTGENSFPFANFGEHQIEDLVMFYELNERTHSFVVIEYRKHGRYFVIPSTLIEGYMSVSARKSIPVDVASEIGLEVFKEKQILKLDYKEMLDEETR